MFGSGWGRKKNHVQVREAQVRSSVHMENARVLASRKTVVEPQPPLDRPPPRRTLPGNAAEEKARALFQMWDADGSGSISKDEMQIVLKEVGVREAAIPKIFACIDTNGDGEISFYEFLDWISGDGNYGFENIMTGNCDGGSSSST